MKWRNAGRHRGRPLRENFRPCADFKSPRRTVTHAVPSNDERFKHRIKIGAPQQELSDTLPDIKVGGREKSGFGRRGRLKKTYWYAAAFAAVMFAVVIVYLLAGSARRTDYDSLATTGGMDCPWREIDCENLSEDEKWVYDVFYSALADLKYPEPVCREITQFYVYNYAACADEPTINEIRYENDRLCIKSSENMNFAFSVDSNVRTIWDLNTGEIIYAVVE